MEYPELSRRQDGSSQLFCIRRKFERFPWEGPLNGSALAGVKTRNDEGLTPVCCGSGPVEIGVRRASRVVRAPVLAENWGTKCKKRLLGRAAVLPTRSADGPRLKWWMMLTTHRRGRSFASLTRTARPSTSRPSMSAMAFFADDASAKERKPNPRERPVSRSITTFASVISP